MCPATIIFPLRQTIFWFFLDECEEQDANEKAVRIAMSITLLFVLKILFAIFIGLICNESLS